MEGYSCPSGDVRNAAESLIQTTNVKLPAKPTRTQGRRSPAVRALRPCWESGKLRQSVMYGQQVKW